MSKVATLSPHGETTERLIRRVSAPPQTHSSPMTSLIDKKNLYEAWPHKSAHVVEELIMTEKSYVDALSDIITVCLIMLLSIANIINMLEICKPT